MVKNVDSGILSHEGKVIGINGTNVRVKIISESACAGCHAKGVCGGANSAERIIDGVYIPENGPSDSSTGFLREGDSVNVIMEEKMGWKAVFYGFFLPFAVMMTVLFSSRGLGASEAGAGIIALTSLVPYYLVLWWVRKGIEKDFVFRVEKIKI